MFYGFEKEDPCVLTFGCHSSDASACARSGMAMYRDSVTARDPPSFSGRSFGTGAVADYTAVLSSAARACPSRTIRER